MISDTEHYDSKRVEEGNESESIYKSLTVTGQDGFGERFLWIPRLSC